MSIKAIIGLGNPGSKFNNTRHNIGFAILDELAKKYWGSWSDKDAMQIAQIRINDQPIMLIKPQTFMNSSGQVIPFLRKKGIEPEQMLVIHDELELPFGIVKTKQGGSHKGHNGVRSIIDAGAKECHRLRFGIGRPESKDEVSDYVLQKFAEPADEINEKIQQAIEMIESSIA